MWSLWLRRISIVLAILVLLPIIIILTPLFLLVLLYDLLFGITTEQVKDWCLLALEDGPKWGYQIQQKIQDLSNGEIDLPIGKLYFALDELVKEGYVERYKEWVQEKQQERWMYRLKGRWRRVTKPETSLSFLPGLRPRGALGLTI